MMLVNIAYALRTAFYSGSHIFFFQAIAQAYVHAAVPLQIQY
jgi:hypothetical protein